MLNPRSIVIDGHRRASTGIDGMTRCIRQAFANDLNDRSGDTNTAGPNPLLGIHEID